MHEPHTYNIWLIIFLFVATYCFHSRDKHIKVKTERKKNRFSYEYLINHLLCSLRIVLRKCRIRLLFYDKSLIWDSAMRPPPWRVTIKGKDSTHSLWQIANARNVSFIKSLRRPIHAHCQLIWKHQVITYLSTCNLNVLNEAEQKKQLEICLT